MMMMMMNKITTCFTLRCSYNLQCDTFVKSYVIFALSLGNSLCLTSVVMLRYHFFDFDTILLRYFTKYRNVDIDTVFSK